MQITRRHFLKSSGALALYAGVSPALNLLNAAPATGVHRGKTLVVIFLRGGLDGLNFVVPYGDKDYYGLRKRIAIARPGEKDGVLELNDTFGLNPRAAALMPLFESKNAVALHAVGYALNTRSHFEEQDVWETGVIGNTVNSDGWLNRHLLTSTGHGQVRAVTIGDSLPRILRGDAPAYALRGISDLSLPGRSESEAAAMTAALEHAYCSTPDAARSAAMDLLAHEARNTLDGMAQLKKLAGQPYQPVGPYPDTGFSKKLQETARLIKADIGLEVVEIDFGGWDTHNNQGGVAGQYGNLVQQLTEGLAAFSRDLESRMDDVLVLTLSDFGRTAAENGTSGTDHGWGNCMLAIGGATLRRTASKSGPVLGKWPGLSKEKLYQGRDLAHTTDFRDVLGEVVGAHLGNENLKRVLPGHEFKPVGLFQPT